MMMTLSPVFVNFTVANDGFNVDRDWHSTAFGASINEYNSAGSTAMFDGNAIDYDFETFALLEARGENNWRELNYAGYSVKIPVASNTTAIDIHLQAVYEGVNPPENAKASISCNVDYDFPINSGEEIWSIGPDDFQYDSFPYTIGWADQLSWITAYSNPIRIQIGGMTHPDSPCSKNNQGEIVLNIQTEHYGNDTSSDETSIYLYEIIEVCEGDCHIPCEENDFDLGIDSSDNIWAANYIDIIPGTNYFSGWVESELISEDDSTDHVWFFIPIGYSVTIQIYTVDDLDRGCAVSIWSTPDLDLYLYHFSNGSIIETAANGAEINPETIITNVSVSGFHVGLEIHAFKGGSIPYDVLISLNQVEISDADEDGWGNGLETDCGSDPYSSFSTPIDTDNDGICNTLDFDDDGDGINDVRELSCGSNQYSNSSLPLDTDSDGNCNTTDLDDDNDGWSDSKEGGCNTDSLDVTSTPSDTDLDGICDTLDLDDDDDGWSDSEEEECNTDSLDATSMPSDNDLDGVCTLIDSDENILASGTNSNFRSNICPPSTETINIGSGYIISYDTDGNLNQTNLSRDSQANKDWDLDGLDNSVDFFPLDSTRAKMPICGTNFGNLGISYDRNLGTGDISSIDAMVVVDWDKDGDYDILIGGTHKDEGQYYGSVMGIQNLGGGEFAKAVSLKNLGYDSKWTVPSLYGDVDDIAVIDLYGDGSELGLIVGSQGWTRYYISNGWNELTFVKEDENPWADDDIETQRARDIIVADIDNDGDQDWAINYRTTESYEDGWKPRVEIFSGHSINSGRPDGFDIESGEVKYNIDWVDVDSDGNLEILACKFHCDIWTPSGFPTIVWSWEGDSTAITSSAISDFDKDGDLDLAIGTQKNIYIFSNYTKNEILYDEPTFILDNKNTRYLHWADIDGNGWLDLLTGNDGRDQIFGNFNGDLSLVWKSESSSKTNFILTADIDLDGDLDIIGSDLDSVFVMNNEKDNSASYYQALEMLFSPYFLLIGLLLCVPLLRVIFMLLCRPEKYLKLGIPLFLFLQIIIFTPIFDIPDQNNDGWHDSVNDCDWNEACTANEFLSSNPILNSYTVNEFNYMALEEEYYQPFAVDFYSGIFLLSLLLVFTLVKHYRKTNFINLGNISDTVRHDDYTVSSVRGFFLCVGLATLFNPLSVGLGESKWWLVIITILFLILGLATNYLLRSIITDFTTSAGINRSAQSLKSKIQRNTYNPNMSQVKYSKKTSKEDRKLEQEYDKIPKYVIEIMNKNKVPQIKKSLILLGVVGFSNLRKKQLIVLLWSKLKSIENELAINYEQEKYLTYKKAAEQVGMEQDWFLPQALHKNNSYVIDEDSIYAHISIDSPIKDIQEVAEAEGRTVQEIYEDLMDDGVINKSNVEKSPVLTQQLNDEFEELIELTVSNAQAYEDWMDLAANGQRMQEGAIAEVWRIKSEQGNLFIKTAHDEKGKKVLLKEIATLEDLMEENLDSIHPHVVFQSKDKDKPLLVMTQVGERSLETDYDNLDIEQGMNFLYDLALDIQRLHEQGHYIHRDLKPGNIAINDTKSGNSIYAGLIDFGSARSNMRKQGEGDRFVSEPWTHPSQREIGVRVRPGQDWYSFTWIAMCVIMGAKYDKIQSMIEGGSFETKFKNKIANIDSINSELVDTNVLYELIELVTKFGETPDLEVLEILAENLILSN